MCGAGRAPLVPSRLAAGIPSAQLCRGLCRQPGRVAGGTRAPAPGRVSRSLPGCCIGATVQPGAPQEWAGSGPGLPVPGGSGARGCNAWQRDAPHARARTPPQHICPSAASDISKAGGHWHHPAFRSSICDSTPKLVCQGMSSPCKPSPQESCTSPTRSQRGLCCQCHTEPGWL